MDGGGRGGDRLGSCRLGSQALGGCPGDHEGGVGLPGADRPGRKVSFDRFQLAHPLDQHLVAGDRRLLVANLTEQESAGGQVESLLGSAPVESRAGLTQERIDLLASPVGRGGAGRLDGSRDDGRSRRLDLRT